MEHYVLLDQIYLMKGELKYMLVVSGLECVIMNGKTVKLAWFVDNWDLDHQGEHYTTKV